MMQVEERDELRNRMQAHRVRIKTEKHTREALIDLAAAHQTENDLLKDRILQLETSLKNCREFSATAAHYAGRGIEYAKKASKSKQDRRKGSDVTHIENRLIKADVFTWLESNAANYKSNPKTADAIIKLQPIAHSTALAYVKEWKNLQSASTL